MVKKGQFRVVISMVKQGQIRMLIRMVQGAVLGGYQDG